MGWQHILPRKPQAPQVKWSKLATLFLIQFKPLTNFNGVVLGCINNDLESLRGIVATICRVPVEDNGMFFDGASVAASRIAEDADYEGVRATFRATLGNTRLPMQIGIGVSDIVTPGPVAIVYQTLLAQPAPEFSAYNRETAIAEKFEAMVKLGELNSRMIPFAIS